MKLQWLGHNAFRLTESTGSSVITDPFEPQAVGYSMAYLPCDAVTSSVAHPAHNHYKGVKGSPDIINAIGVRDINGIQVSGVYSRTKLPAGNGKNLIFRLRLDGVSVCHMGALADECSAELIEELIPVNILLLPVGGGFTLGAEEAKEYVDNIMPDIVIPMHYKTKSTELDIDKADAFLRLFDDDQIIVADDDTIEFDRYDFTGESTKVVLPKRFMG
ncbi:MAG: MBL fold metallo-hydrolase [Clostridiales bacterium]|jgi:L-ascorbate metabolism protein UlaG (beta-lactamase superfamily)|nr:MBL fold metallo-hydrolase [Clostridiales bacterium]